MSFRKFVFERSEDVSGVSGIGIVAEGIEFSNGKTVIAWCVPGKPNSAVIYDNIHEAIEVHGHEGRTVIKWID